MWLSGRCRGFNGKKMLKETTVKQEIGSLPMGANKTSNGIAFKVWAPNAQEVFITGTFNDFSPDSHPMEKSENGIWVIEIPEADYGDQYKYRIINGEQELFRNDPYARELTDSAGNTIIVDPNYNWGDDNFKLAPWNELVIYEMHVGTFNTVEQGKPGNFKTVIDKLPYLKSLGINAIQIMPPLEFPGGFSWGYNLSHPFAIETEYGGVNGFKDLVKAAHTQGIGIILDVVFNHLGPCDLDLWRFDGWYENDLGGIYFYNDWRAETPWGHTRPDYGRGEVRSYLKDNALMWITEYKVDGLRFDSVLYMRNVEGYALEPDKEIPEAWSVLQWINEEIKKVKPEVLTIAEDLTGNEWVTKSVEDGGAGFSTQWDMSFGHPVRAAITSPEDESRNMEAVGEALTKYYNGDHIHRVIYTESHDEVANGKVRIPEEIMPGKVSSWYAKKRSTLGAGLVFSAPGIPMIFQGQEFLEDRWFTATDPLEWCKAEKFDGIVHMYRELIALRKNTKGTTAGLAGPFIQVNHINNNDKIIAFHRWDKGGTDDSVMLIFNFANKAHENYNIGLPSGGLWKARLNSDWEGFDERFSNHDAFDIIANKGEKDGYEFNANISIGPYSFLVYSLGKQNEQEQNELELK